MGWLSLQLHLYVHICIQSILIVDHFKVNQLSSQKNNTNKSKMRFII